MVPAFRVMVPGIKRLEVIANPLPNELLGINKTIVTEQNHYRVIAMGRLIASKQFSGLIESFASLAVDFPNWNLWIWGEGPLRMQLEEQIDRNGLNERVFLPGRTSTPWEELVKGEIFVLSSAYEGLPMALLEAMALKLPCVAFDCPSGPREITQGGQNALLVTLNDWQGLTEALRQLMSSFALREELGKKAAVSVRERYALDGILQRWDPVSYTHLDVYKRQAEALNQLMSDPRLLIQYGNRAIDVRQRFSMERILGLWDCLFEEVVSESTR